MAATSATRRVRPSVWAAFFKPLLVAWPFRVRELRPCILPLLAPATREQCQALSAECSEGLGRVVQFAAPCTMEASIA